VRLNRRCAELGESNLVGLRTQGRNTLQRKPIANHANQLESMQTNCKPTQTNANQLQTRSQINEDFKLTHPKEINGPVPAFTLDPKIKADARYFLPME